MHKLLQFLFPEEKLSTDFVRYVETVPLKNLPFAYTVLYEYSEDLKKYLHQIKFAQDKRLIKHISKKILADHRLGNPIDMLIPVPTHPVRQQSRGFEHTAELIRNFAYFHKIPLRIDMVYREYNTRPLFNLSAAERKREVADSFKVWPTKASELKGKNILIFDDILTTGRTLQAVYDCLLPYQPSSITALCLSRPVIKPSSPLQHFPSRP